MSNIKSLVFSISGQTYILTVILGVLAGRFEQIFGQFAFSAATHQLSVRESKPSRDGGEAKEELGRLLSFQPENKTVELAVSMRVFKSDPGLAHTPHCCDQT